MSMDIHGSGNGNNRKFNHNNNDNNQNNNNNSSNSNANMASNESMSIIDDTSTAIDDALVDRPFRFQSELALKEKHQPRTKEAYFLNVKVIIEQTNNVSTMYINAEKESGTYVNTIITKPNQLKNRTKDSLVSIIKHFYPSGMCYIFISNAPNIILCVDLIFCAYTRESFARLYSLTALYISIQYPMLIIKINLN